jgi:hypothetical protein
METPPAHIGLNISPKGLIVPPQLLEQEIKEVTAHNNGIDTIEVVTEATALNRLQRFQDHSADSLNELSDCIEQVDAANAPKSNPQKQQQQ